MAATAHAALLSLIDFTEIGCVTEQDRIGAPPLCRPDEADGTLLDVLPHGSCEGRYARRGELDWVFDMLLGLDWRLYGVVDNGEPAPDASLFGSGPVWMVLASEDRAVSLNVTEDGIASMRTGCGLQSAEAMLLNAGGSNRAFLLQPPETPRAQGLPKRDGGEAATTRPARRSPA
ncbi:MAG TPA: hypothetical protein QGI71_11610 [Dehalococcoidia bacterium]|nr:hypothetical protein [Dehalococcoidia bacterium]